VRIGVPFADLTAPLFGVIGILAALRHLDRTGRGQFVDISMLGALTTMVAGEPFDILERCGVPQRTGQVVPRLAPFGLYPTADGSVAICAPTEPFARALFGAMDRPDLARDPRFATRDQRVRHVDALNALIEDYTRRYSTADVLRRLEGAGIPAAEVRSPNEAVRDPRVLGRGETVRLAHPTHGQVDDVIGQGLPIRFSESAAGFDRTAPALGEHNDAIYGGYLGYSPARIDGLRQRGVI
jgi:crotonobetainyl-CoA:carnitine CoA-transferase CaiB-like acyl-CoA transferase